MIHMTVLFIVITLVVALVYGAWSTADKEERSLVLRALFKGAVFASITFVFLFIIVNLF